jgi:TP901-1 family phage major tail protein
MTLNNEQVDTTSKDGTYWRQMVAGGVRSMSISGGGIMDSSTHVKAMRTAAMNNTLNNYRLINTDGDYFQGQFQVTSWGESGEYNGAHEYTLTLESSGDIAFTDV